MKKFALLAVFISQITNYLAAQNSSQRLNPTVVEKSDLSAFIKVSLSGRITDARTGEPLPGASVYLVNDKVGTSADAQGRYTINNIPDGHHVLEISHAGYASVVEHIELSANTEKNYALLPVITENQGVIVTGVSSATSVRKSPVAVATLRRTALLQTTSTNIIDALTKIPGVSQASTGPAVSKPVIRGLGYNRVVTINEGARQEGQQWGDEHGIEIDELSIVRAEVLKGPASLMYGSDAMAGVLNLISHVPVTDGTIKANLLGNYQANNRLVGFNGSVAGNKNGFNWNVYGTYKSAGDYQNKYDGRVLNSRFNEKNFGGYIGLNKSWGYSHLIFSRFNQQIGMVEGDRDPSTGKFILFSGSALERIATGDDLKSRDLFVPRQHVQHNKVVSDNNLAIGKSRLKINLGYQNNKRQEFGNPEDPDEKELYFELKTLSYNVQWQLPEMKEWHTSFGINGMGQSNANKGEETLIPEYDLFDIGTFVYTQRFFKKSTLSGGLRFDNRTVDSRELIDGTNIKFPAFKRSFSNFSGSVGISLEPSETVTVKANVARGFRAPGLSELASNGTHEGTNRYEYGDIDLKSEISLQLDAGLELNFEHFHIGLSAFYNRINHFIFYRKLESAFGGDSLVNVDGEDVTAFQFNQQDATLKGVEATIDIHPHPLDWLHFENSISFVRGRFDEAIDGSSNLPLIPAARLVSELRGNFSNAGKSWRNVYIKLEADNVFRQSRPFSGFDTETSTAGYTLLNAGAGGEWIGKNKKTLFSVYLSLNNITDKTYQHHLSRLKYAAVNQVTGRIGVFNMGRNFSVKVNVPLEFSE